MGTISCLFHIFKTVIVIQYVLNICLLNDRTNLDLCFCIIDFVLKMGKMTCYIYFNSPTFIAGVLGNIRKAGIEVSDNCIFT